MTHVEPDAIAALWEDLLQRSPLPAASRRRNRG